MSSKNVDTAVTCFLATLVGSVLAAIVLPGPRPPAATVPPEVVAARGVHVALIRGNPDGLVFVPTLESERRLVAAAGDEQRAAMRAVAEQLAEGEDEPLRRVVRRAAEELAGPGPWDPALLRLVLLGAWNAPRTLGPLEALMAGALGPVECRALPKDRALADPGVACLPDAIVLNALLFED